MQTLETDTVELLLCRDEPKGVAGGGDGRQQRGGNAAQGQKRERRLPARGWVGASQRR